MKCTGIGITCAIARRLPPNDPHRSAWCRPPGSLIVGKSHNRAAKSIVSAVEHEPEDVVNIGEYAELFRLAEPLARPERHQSGS
jgi:hypothetical protein